MSLESLEDRSVPATLLDFGDAPISYGTLLADGGASHVAAGPTLGALRDAETDGQSHFFAQGDDASGDDEDGVFAANLVLGQTTTFTINVNGGPAKLDAWVDFNRNGVFEDVTERITAAGGTSVVVGTNTLAVTPPADTSFGLTFARFRLSSSGGLTPAGLAVDGEVEDCPLHIYSGSKISMFGGPNNVPGVSVMNPDGTGTKLLASVFGPPTWSPDGSKLIIGAGGFYTVNADGSNLKQVFNTLNAGGLSSWSPDGTKFAYINNGELVTRAIDSSGKIDMGVFPPNYPDWAPNFLASAETRLTNTPGVSETHPSWAPDGRRLVFERAGSIYAINADGSGETRLTSAGSSDSAPSWSPDGSKIAFTRNFVIYVMNVDGTGVTPLTTSVTFARTATWSPDGRKIAFDRWINPAHTSRIVVMNADGTDLVEITPTFGSDTASPAWGGIVLSNTANAAAQDFGDAPASYGSLLVDNGARHALGSVRLGTNWDGETSGQPHSFAQGDDSAGSDDEDGVFAANLVLGQTTIFTIDVSGGPAKLDAWVDFNRNGVFDDATERITVAGGSPMVAGRNTLAVAPPSATSFGLSYARFRLSTAGGLAPTGSAFDGEVEDHPIHIYAATKIAYYTSDIFVMNPDGTQKTNLTNTPAGEYSPTWSPDGRSIAFLRSPAQGSFGTDLRVMNADGSGERPVPIQTPLQISGLAWSPDGTRFVFAARKQNETGSSIYVLNVDGSGLTRLTTQLGDTSPTWSPDGRRIAFTREPVTNRIMIINADGTGEVEFRRGPFATGYPAWSPDGRQIVLYGGNDLFLKNVDDGVEINLTNSARAEQRSAWSPDGSKLAMERDHSWLDLGIFTINRDGTGATELAGYPAFGPAWGGIAPFVDPKANAGGSYTVSEDGAITLSGVASFDPDSAIVSYEWDLDNNGTFEIGPSSSATAIFSAASLEGGMRTVRLRVTDTDGRQAVDTATVNVTNIKPAIGTFSGDWVPEGAVYVVRLGDVVDPDPDTVTSYRINWGDGTSTNGTGDPSARTAMHVYKDEGNYTVTIDLTDEDGTHPACGSKNIVVTNVATFLSGSLSDSLVVDRNGNGVADAGDVIEYTATVTYDGPDNATNVTYTARPDPNTTLVTSETRREVVVFTDSFDGAANAAWVQNVPSFGVAGNRLTGNSGRLVNLATVGAPETDVRVQADYDLRWSTAFNHFGLVARHQGMAGDQDMYAGIVYGTPGSHFAGIWRNVGGEWSQLVSAPTNVAAGLLRFEAVGGALRLLVNDVLVATTFDVTFREGQSGVRLGTGIFADSFNITRLGSLTFRDDFERPASDDVGSAIAEGAAQGMLGDYAIQNGQLVGAGGFVNVASIRDSRFADVSVQADVSLSGPGFVHQGVIARYQRAGDRDMYAGVLWRSSDKAFLSIFKNVAGEWSILNSKEAPGTSGRLRLEVIGSSLRLFFNDELVASATDSSIPDAGLAGVRSSSGQAFENVRITALSLPSAGGVQNLGTLLPGETVRAVYRAVVNNPLPANVTRVGQQGAFAGNDSGTGIPFAPAVTNVVSRSVFGAPDLGVAISGPAEVQTEDDIVYTIDLANLGTRGATGVLLRVTFPMDMTLRGGNIDGQPAAWTPGSGQTFDLFVGDVAGRTGRKVTLVVKPTITYHATHQLTASVTIVDDGTQGSDFNPLNNSGSHTMLLRGPQHPFLDW